MKHCHFAIVYNELPFLKQKMAFLYENFDQLIFYDMYAMRQPYHYSTDGSHEYLKDYPDPDNKITLIESLKFPGLTNYPGLSVDGKKKMFVVGSEYVRDDIDVYWSIGVDEFFDTSLIHRVEQVYETKPEVKTINVPHIIFFKDFNTVFCDQDGTYLTRIFNPRITRHTKGNVYGHCSLGRQFRPIEWIFDDCFYHYAYIGTHRMKDKAIGNPPHWVKVIENTDTTKLSDRCYGYPKMHPSLKKGIKRYDGKHPDYIDIEELDIMINKRKRNK